MQSSTSLEANTQSSGEKDRPISETCRIIFAADLLCSSWIDNSHIRLH